jgi:hypothetical protein
MEIRAWFDGVQIDEVGPEYLQGFRSNPAKMIEPGNRIYSLRGADWEGFVVGGIISSLEDDGNINDPSGLLGK